MARAQFCWLFIASIICINSVWLSLSQRSGPPYPYPTNPFWLVDAPFQDTHTTDVLPERAGVVIIGAGMSGASVAFHLTKVQNQNEILLLDARGVAGGATGRNGGLLGTMRSTGFQSMANSYDSETAININAWAINTVQYVQSLNAEFDWNAQIVTNGSITGFVDSSEIEPLQESLEYMQSFGVGYDFSVAVPPAINELSLSPLLAGGSVATNSADADSSLFGYFWPARVVFGLVDEALKTGNLNLQTQTMVTSVVENEGVDRFIYPWIVHCNGTEGNTVIPVGGGSVHARKVVFATNGYTSYLLPEYTDAIVPVKNQVIASDALDAFVWQPLLYSFGLNFGYEYFHQRVSDHRIIIGGGRDIVLPDMWFGDYDDTYIDAEVSEYLRGFLSTYFPSIAAVNDDTGIAIFMEWAGIMGFSEDGLPWIGPVVGKAEQYICAGYTGSGMSYALNAGKAIASMIVGETPNPFDNHFLPAARNGIDDTTTIDTVAAVEEDNAVLDKDKKKGVSYYY